MLLKCTAGTLTSAVRAVCTAGTDKELSARKRQAFSSLHAAKVPAVHALSQAAMAGMAPLQAEHLSGYRVHPSILDASLHLSAAAIHTDTPEAAATRVPVGISVLTVTDLKQGHTPIPLAQPSRPEQDGSVLCQCRLLAGNTCSIQVSDLLAKQARPLSSAPLHAPAGVADVLMSELLYEKQWQVATLASRGSVPQQPYFALTRPIAGTVKKGFAAAYGQVAPKDELLSQAALARTGLCALLSPFSSRCQGLQAIGAPVQAASALLELWQTMSTQCHGKPVSLFTTGQLSTDLAGSNSCDVTSTAAAAALMRVAAAENPGIAIACVTSSPFTPMRHEVHFGLQMCMEILACLHKPFCMLLLFTQQSEQSHVHCVKVLM